MTPSIRKERNNSTPPKSRGGTIYQANCLAGRTRALIAPFNYTGKKNRKIHVSLYCTLYRLVLVDTKRGRRKTEVEECDGEKGDRKLRVKTKKKKVMSGKFV